MFRFVIFIKEINRGKKREKELRTALFRFVKIWEQGKQTHIKEKNYLVLSDFHISLRKINLIEKCLTEKNTF